MQITPTTNINLALNPSFEATGQTSFVTPLKISVSDSTKMSEFVNRTRLLTGAVNVSDSTITSEAVTVVATNALNKPNVNDATVASELIQIIINNTSSLTDWTVTGGTATQISSDSVYGNSAARLVSTGSTQFLSQNFTCTINTAYVAQLYVKGTAGVVVTLKAVENAVTIGTVSGTLDGKWDLLALPSFTTDGTHTTFTLEVYPTTSTTILIDAVMVQLASGATTSYFDGSFGTGYAWTGLANLSTSTYNAFVAIADSDVQSRPQFGALIDWTKALNVNAGFFTINSSAIGSSDFIPGTQTFPTFYNQYAYTDYSQYLLSVSIQKSIGQYPYGIFAAQMVMQLDNTDLSFLPGYDPVIGNYIISGRPITFGMAFGGQSISLFMGTTIRPENDLQNRMITLTAYDGADYLNQTLSYGLGTLAQANGGVYVNVAADQIIADLLEEAGFATNQYVLDISLQANPIGYLSPFNYASQNGTVGTIGGIIADICAAESGIFFFDENGVARFWNYQHIQLQQTPVWSFDYDDIINFQLEDTPIINDVIINASPRVVQSKQFIWQLTESQAIPAPSGTITYTNQSINPSFENDTVGWGTPGGGTLTRIATDAWVGNACAQLVSTGSGQYMRQSLSTPTATPYVAQCFVKGTASAVVTIAAIENGVTLKTASVTLDGGWDMLQLPQFTTDSVNSTFEIRIFPTTSQTIKVDGLMVQVATNASPTYFDGNTTDTTSFVYAWTGTGNDSSSTATPCGTFVIEADFQDDFGSLPVTEVDTPVYVAFATGSSNYSTNLVDDGSGDTQSSSISLVSTQLMGSTYLMTFANTFSLPVFITSLGLYGTPAKVTQNISIEYIDPISVALNGTNPANNGEPLIIDNDLIQNNDTANSDAYILVNNFSVPYQRLIVDVFSVPQLQFGDVVSLTINDSGQTLLYTVVGITNGVNNDGEITQSLELNVFQLQNYFTVNVSSINGLSAIAP